MTRTADGRRRALAVLISLPLAGCITVGVGNEAAPRPLFVLHDAGPAPVARDMPLVPALLLQALPGDAVAETESIAYSRQPDQIAFYQLAGWSERPVRRVPQLLRQRLEARGIAGAVGLVGDPLQADWLLTVAVDTLVHDMRQPPGEGRVGITLELFDRRGRGRLARRRFEAAAPAAQADSAAAAQAMSVALGQVFDAALPWIEAQLGRAAAARQP